MSWVWLAAIKFQRETLSLNLEMVMNTMKIQWCLECAESTEQELRVSGVCYLWDPVLGVAQPAPGMQTARKHPGLKTHRGCKHTGLQTHRGWKYPGAANKQGWKYPGAAPLLLKGGEFSLLPLLTQKSALVSLEHLWLQKGQNTASTCFLPIFSCPDLLCHSPLAQQQSPAGYLCSISLTGVFHFWRQISGENALEWPFPLKRKGLQ